MLNLTEPIIYTATEEAHIARLLTERDQYGNLLTGTASWAKGDAATYGIKGRISSHTLAHQKCRCAYCESLLQQGEAEIEHIVHKGRHRDFVFEPENLVTACRRCNSTKIKGTKETIVPPEHVQYAQNSFLIVHPYLCANPDEEIVFTDETKTTFDKAACTQLGLDTIEFFHWDDEDARLARLREAPLREVRLDIAKLVREISTYK